MSYELLIQHGSNIMYPPTVEGVTIEWERKGQPGKLTFEVVKTPGLSFQEGDPCRFSVDGTPVFYGFVFEKSRKGNNPNVIKCVVYDQLYYLKNKDTYADLTQKLRWWMYSSSGAPSMLSASLRTMYCIQVLRPCNLIFPMYALGLFTERAPLAMRLMVNATLLCP